MTRETKLGLVVGTSFVSLLAVVLFNSWKKAEEPPPAPEAPLPAAETRVAVVDSKPAPVVEPKQQPGPHDPGVLQVKAQSDLLPKDTPPVVHDLTPVPPTPQPLPIPHEPDKGTVVPTAPPFPPGGPSLPGLPPLPPTEVAPAPPPGGPVHKEDSKPLLPPGSPPVNPVKDVVPLIPPGGEEVGPPAPPRVAAADPLVPKVKDGPPPVVLPGGPPLPPYSDLLPKSPEAPVVAVVPGGPPNLVPPPGNEKPVVPPGSPTPVEDPKSVKPIVVNPVMPGDPKEPKGLPPLVGDLGNKGVTSPPIPVPVTTAPDPKAQHFEYQERKYVCEPADTDFAAVSRRFYQTDKYTAALIEYNRDHVWGRDAAKQAPQLRPGAEVMIPQLHVLETRYPNLIGAAAAAPQPEPAKSFVQISDGPPTSKAVPVVNPPSAGWNPPPVVPPTTPSVVPVPQNANAGTKMYWVPQGGQRLWQIAQQTMGDGNLWTEIYRLNPTLNPEMPVPAGTQIQLPANARLDP
jgi:hypothetical protein